MTREVPTLNLEQVSVLAASQSPNYEYFHTIGLLKQECERTGGTCWNLFDEFHDGVVIKLGGQLTEYPRPKPGDIVRIHRLKLNKELHIPVVVNPKNVVIWTAFQHEPQPITVARSPTISEEDVRRRRILESFFTSKIHRIIELQVNPGSLTRFYNVAGQVETMSHDQFGHLEIGFTDGTGRSIMRVFVKRAYHEVDVHFEIASKLIIGDHFVAMNAKLDLNGKRLNLSANQSHGRSFRKVEKTSILGTTLSQMMEHCTIEPLQENIDLHPTDNQMDTNEPSGSTRRRSPRFLHKDSPQVINTSSNNQSANPSNDLSDSIQARNYCNLQAISERPVEAFPHYTPYSDIRQRDGGYEFHDIVGQIREGPRETNYGNYIMQIYDGSLHNLANFHAFEVKHVLDGCLILYVYSKQKALDTNEHIEMAKKLKEADLIYVRNVRVSFKAGKVKLELSANKNHNKSINVIDKDSAFGRKLLDIVETPQVDELREMIDPYASIQE